MDKKIRNYLFKLGYSKDEIESGFALSNAVYERATDLDNGYDVLILEVS